MPTTADADTETIATTSLTPRRLWQTIRMRLILTHGKSNLVVIDPQGDALAGGDDVPD